MSTRIGLTLAVLAGATATPTAFSQYCYGTGFGPGRSVRYLGSHRLYRHRSGYLYGYDRPYSYGRIPYVGYGGSGHGRPAAGYDVDACHLYTDPRQDFDRRRDRLLRAAANVVVSVPGAPAGAPAPSPGRADDVGWDLLVEGRAVKALGHFTARIISAPTSGRARIGYALAAALFEDDGAAVHAMRQAMRVDPDSLRDFGRDVGVDARIRELLVRYPAPRDSDAVFMSAALHLLLGEREEARLVLANDAKDGDGRLFSALRSGLRPHSLPYGRAGVNPAGLSGQKSLEPVNPADLADLADAARAMAPARSRSEAAKPHSRRGGELR